MYSLEPITSIKVIMSETARDRHDDHQTKNGLVQKALGRVTLDGTRELCEQTGDWPYPTMSYNDIVALEGLMDQEKAFDMRLEAEERAKNNPFRKLLLGIPDEIWNKYFVDDKELVSPTEKVVNKYVSRLLKDHAMILAQIEKIETKTPEKKNKLACAIYERDLIEREFERLEQMGLHRLREYYYKPTKFKAFVKRTWTKIKKALNIRS